jgi:peptidoglycan/xylan/chitin deacetylase (PgdA/CDA1 family)
MATHAVRRGVSFISSFLVVFFFASSAYAQSVNLISNGSLETAAGSAPSGWISGYWGTPKPTFAYPVAGHTGNGASVTLSANSSGDANWQPSAPVAVTAGSSYTYSTWYNSNAATEIDAEYTSSKGTISYAWLANVPSSGGVWKQATVSFTIPSGMTKVLVYQLIFNKGTLTIDDISLSGGSTTPPANPTVSISASPSSITAGQSSTLTWSSTNATSCTASGGWSGTEAVSGTLSVAPTATSTYTLTCTGNGSSVSQSATVNVSAATPPPAAPTVTLSASPTSITSGQSSTLTWSSTNATSCTASGGWTGSKATSGTQSISPTANTTYTLACTGNGSTVSKSVSITVSAPATGNTFSEGMVTLSFDDAWASQYTNALPILQASGLPATFYFISEVIQNNSNFPGYLTPAMATTIANDGYEIGDHTITHPDLTTLTSAQVTNEITASRTYLQGLLGKTITTIAYPYGAVNTSVENLTKQAGYTSARGVDDSQLNTPKTDPLNLYGQCIENTESVATIESWIDKAKANKQWYILCIHEIGTTDGGQQYSMPISEFQTILNYIKSSGIKTVTVSQGRALMAN